MGLLRGVTAPFRKAGTLGFLIRNVRLAWGLVRDPRVSLLTKLSIPGIVLLYVVSPAFLLNAIPVVGEIDDLAVAALAVGLFLRLAPRSVVEEHRARLEGAAAFAPVTAEYQAIP